MDNTNIVERLRADAESTDDIGLCAEAADMIEALQQELAASRAREKGLRDALVNAQARSPCPMYAEALAIQTDDSALQEYIDNLPEIQLLNEIGRMLGDVEYKGSYVDGIKTLLAAERERCAKVFDERVKQGLGGYEASAIIRALGG